MLAVKEGRKMKVIKLCGVTFLLVLCLGSSASWAISYTYSFLPKPRADLWGLNHHHYYAWGIDWADRDPDPPANEVIKSATLEIRDIYNWRVEDNDYLYVTINKFQILA